VGKENEEEMSKIEIKDKLIRKNNMKLTLDINDKNDLEL